MMIVNIYGPGDECYGSWFPEEDQVQVPRKGDILWLATDEIKHSRWRVENVQWVFRNEKIGIGRTRMISAEVHAKPYPAAPLWERFVNLFPARA